MTHPARALTDRQREVLTTVYRLMGELGASPTIRELQVALGIKSPNGIAANLDALEKKGFIRGGVSDTERSRWRGIRLVGLRMVPTFTGDAAGAALRAALRAAAAVSP